MDGSAMTRIDSLVDEVSYETDITFVGKVTPAEDEWVKYTADLVPYPVLSYVLKDPEAPA